MTSVAIVFVLEMSVYSSLRGAITTHSFGRSGAGVHVVSVSTVIQNLVV